LSALNAVRATAEELMKQSGLSDEDATGKFIKRYEQMFNF